jgi:hypothetical protein
MHAQESVAGDERRLGPSKRAEPLVVQTPLDSAQAVWLFRVSPAHLML